LFQSHLQNITSVYIEKLRITSSARKKSPDWNKIFLVTGSLRSLKLRPFGITTTGSNSSTSS
jgi:hypothetical protein